MKELDEFSITALRLLQSAANDFPDVRFGQFPFDKQWMHGDPEALAVNHHLVPGCVSRRVISHWRRRRICGGRGSTSCSRGGHIGAAARLTADFRGEHVGPNRAASMIAYRDALCDISQLAHISRPSISEQQLFS